MNSTASTESSTSAWIAKPPVSGNQQHKDIVPLGFERNFPKDPDVEPRSRQAHDWLTTTKARFRGRDGRPTKWEDLDFFTQAGLTIYFVRPIGDRREFEASILGSVDSAEHLESPEEGDCQKPWGEKRFGWLAKTEIDPKEEMRRIDTIFASEQRRKRDSIVSATSITGARSPSELARQEYRAAHEMPNDFPRHIAPYETVDFTDGNFTMLARDQPTLRDSWHSSKMRPSTISACLAQEFALEGRVPWRLKTGINAGRK